MMFKRTGSAAVVLAFAGVLAGAAAAQEFGGGPGGAFGGPAGASPIIASPMGLLMRSEVQNEIHLDLKQKNAIGDILDQSQADAQQKLGAEFRSLRNLPPAQRQQRLAQMRAQMQASANTYQGELPEKIKAILKPEQVTRLHQLDVQKRGPLSMADPKVADEVKLTPEHRTQIGAIFNQYQQDTQKVIQDAFQQMREQVQQNGGLQPGQAPPVPDFTNKLSPYRRKLDKSKKDAENQALALLSDDERANWKQATGAPFTFRPDPTT